MKKFNSTLFCFLFIFTVATAQNPIILGLDCDGGAYGKGRIFKIDNNYSSVNSLKELAYVEGQMDAWSANWCLANNGKYYNVIGYSDRHESLIYEFDINSNSYNIVYRFDPNQFTYPIEGLVKAPNGLLYGVTRGGGINGNGVIYSFDPLTKTTNLLHSFDTTVNMPHHAPILAKNNKLYGTYKGRRVSWQNDGGIYKFDIQSNVYSRVHQFNGYHGAQLSKLVEGVNGDLYGASEDNSNAMVFKFNYVSNSYSQFLVLHNSINYADHFSDLFFYNNFLYITAFHGYNTRIKTSGSVIFKVDASQNYGSIHSTFQFVDSTQGGRPYGKLYMNSKKELIGTLSTGGPNNTGAIFKIDTNLSSVVVKHPYSKPKRVFNPAGDLITLNDSTFIGFTSNDPEKGNYASYVNKYEHGIGSIYQYNLYTDTLNSIVQYGKSDVGHVPTNNLIEKGNGIFYWSNKRGGANFAGTIVGYNFPTNSIKKYHDVDSNLVDQINVMISLNNTTLLGLATKDTFNHLFEYHLLNDSFAIVHTFPHWDPETYYPAYGLTKASNGKVYGISKPGLIATVFDIFEYDPITKNTSVVYDLASLGIDLAAMEFQEFNQKLYSTYSLASFSSNTIGVMEYDYINDSVTLHQYNTSSLNLKFVTPLALHSNNKMYGLVSEQYNTYLIEFDPMQTSPNQFVQKLKVEDYLIRSNGKFLEASNGKMYFKTSNQQTHRIPALYLSKIMEYDLLSNSLNTIHSSSNKSNCYDINNFILFNDIYTSVQDKSKESNINLYPNPANNYITITGLSDINSIEIYNSKGQIMKSESHKTNQIDVSGFNPGIYIIRVKTEKGIEVKKFVKQ
jgi:uncharacterized repeat protein (TIGR03803 family)